jgi:hypothetical protein
VVGIVVPPAVAADRPAAKPPLKNSDATEWPLPTDFGITTGSAIVLKIIQIASRLFRVGLKGRITGPGIS